MSERVLDIDEVAEVRASDVAKIKYLRISEEVLTDDALMAFPDLSGLSERDLIVMMAVAHGFSYREINRATKITLGTISNIVRRCDPCGRYRLDDEGMKAFISKRARAKTAEIMGTLEMDEVRECSPVQKVKMMKTLSEVSAIQDRKESSGFGGKNIKSVTVEFVDEIDEARPISEVVEEKAY